MSFLFHYLYIVSLSICKWWNDWALYLWRCCFSFPLKQKKKSQIMLILFNMPFPGSQTQNPLSCGDAGTFSWSWHCCTKKQNSFWRYSFFISRKAGTQLHNCSKYHPYCCTKASCAALFGIRMEAWICGS